MSTPILDGLRVRLVSSPDQIEGEIESPARGETPDGLSLPLAGWAAGTSQPVTHIQISRAAYPLIEIPVDHERNDLLTHFPDRPWVATAGFVTTIDALTLDPVFELRLRAVLADGTSAPFATIRGQRRAELGGYAPRFQPLLLTSLGRTGSTWMMRLLAGHPGVLTYPTYPYEVRPAKYWLHLFRVLSGRPNPAKVVGQPHEFHLEALAVGANPFRAPAFEPIPALEAWSGSTYVERLAAFCQQSIDEWYGTLAATNGESEVVYFAEKHFPDHFPRLAWSLYPRGREVILVRDFRDMVTSMLAYNQKRGFDDFGRVRRPSDEAWVRSLRRGVNELARAWTRRGDRAHLVRYEDLVAEPETIMRGVFEYLGLDASPALVGELVRKSTSDRAELTKHQTTRDPAASIGRWRHDLPPALRSAANEAFQHGLVTFGYRPE